MLKELILNVKSQADMQAFESAQQSIKGLADGAQGLSNMFDQLARSGAGAQKMDFGKMLGSAGLIKEAWDLGSQIGDAIGGSITRVSERGFSLTSILGGYDPRNDPAIAAMRDQLFALRQSIEQPPAQIGLVDALKAIGAAADETIAKLEHLRTLESIGQDEDRRIMREGLDAREGMIKDSTQLSPEEKERAVAELQKERLVQEHGFRQEDRYKDVDRATEAEEAAGKALFETDVTSSRAIDAQKRRKEQADAAAAKALQEFSDQGGSESDPKAAGKFIEGALKKQGLGTPKEEQQQLNQLTQDREKNLGERREDLEKARRKREQAGEVADAKQGIDTSRTEEQIRKVNTDLAGKRHDERVSAAQAAAQEQGQKESAAAFSEGQAQASGKAPAATTAAAAQKVADSSSEIAGDIRQVTQSLLESNQRVAASVSDLARAVQANTQQIQKAEQMAATALQIAQQAKQQTRTFNR